MSFPPLTIWKIAACTVVANVTLAICAEKLLAEEAAGFATVRAHDAVCDSRAAGWHAQVRPHDKEMGRWGDGETNDSPSPHVPLSPRQHAHNWLVFGHAVRVQTETSHRRHFTSDLDVPPNLKSKIKNPKLPSVPPAPAAENDLSDAQPPTESIDLPPLEQELQHHGGSYLYEPLDVAARPYRERCDPHDPLLRLPENWDEPQPPVSLPNDFLGPGFVQWDPDLHGHGEDPYMWEPRFVLHGGYELFGAYFDQDGTERNGVGHQLFVDLDYRLTGTERFHVQFRPLGEENTGGSFWQLNSPDRYIDNSTGIPQRWWFEGELQSLFGPWGGDETRQLDVNFTLGRFPFRLHNGLLMNDEILGVVVAKNNILDTPLSNLNVQLVYAPDEVDSFPGDSDLYGVHLSADYRHLFFEGTYAYLDRSRMEEFAAHYLAASATQFFGPLTLAGRTMYRIAGDSGTEDGHFHTIESNWMRVPGDRVRHLAGIEQTVTYFNLFYASDNWSPISGGNIDRLRNSFAVDPLLNIAAGTMAPSERYGASVGIQFFRLHQDESLIPEFAYENRSSADVWGIGLRYQRKLCSRMFLELNGVRNWSEEPVFERKGVFLSSTVIF